MPRCILEYCNFATTAAPQLLYCLGAVVVPNHSLFIHSKTSSQNHSVQVAAGDHRFEAIGCNVKL